MPIMEGGVGSRTALNQPHVSGRAVIFYTATYRSRKRELRGHVAYEP